MISSTEGKDGSTVKKILSFLLVLGLAFSLAGSIGCSDTKKDTKGGSTGGASTKP
jgi:hypothetical protein